MDTRLHTQHVPQQFLIRSGLVVIYLSTLRITFYLDAHRRSHEHCCMCELIMTLQKCKKNDRHV